MAKRDVMRVLGRRGLADGRYCEDPSGMEWLTAEAADVTQAVLEDRDPGDVLVDTGWWSDDEGPFPAGLRDELIEAARS